MHKKVINRKKRRQRCSTNMNLSPVKIPKGKGTGELMIFDYCPVLGFSFRTKTIRL